MIEFVYKAKKIHGNKYNYSLVEYKNNKTKVKIICPNHGIFEQKPNNHLNGNVCPKCANIIRHEKLTIKNTKKFIEESKKIHGNKYDYSLVEYKNSKTKVKIICPEHGVFEQIPNNHLSKKQGCPQCYGNKNMTNEIFIEKSRKIHGNKYDYSLIEYKNNRTKVKIICPKHGIFEQIPDHHLRNQGCLMCSGLKKSNTIEFIEKSRKIHGNKYDYSLVEYKNNKIKVKIICPEHGIFEQVPSSHLQSIGCPICNESKGEKEITKILNENNIKYIRQKKFKKCKNKKLLSFDFYLPEKNICIEYDGIQHFKAIEYFGGEKTLNEIKKRDKIKTKFCKENNIKLIRIKYNENIKDKLFFSN